MRANRTILGLLGILATTAGAQERGGFITMLGTDTVQVERFVRDGRTTTGTVVMRTPSLRIMKWTMTYDDHGHPTRYAVSGTDAKGAPLLNGYTGTLAFVGDSIVRQAYMSDTMQTRRMAAPNGATPYPFLPYLGVSYLMYEDALNAARARAASSADSAIYWLTMSAGQPSPNKTHVWIAGPDSMEADYFGVARSGYRFDGNGRLLRADWRRTTYRYRTTRLASIDLESITGAWTAAEQAGHGIGPMSPRDSSNGMIDTSHFTIDYGRPSKRGRPIWGGVVPNDNVWRLGADMATHFTTSTDLFIGDKLVPAGRYTLWMIPSDTAPMLVVSSAVNVFGTNYNPTKDFARIPIRRTKLSAPLERLTVGIHDGALWISWDDAAWTVPVRVKK